MNISTSTYTSTVIAVYLTFMTMNTPEITGPMIMIIRAMRQKFMIMITKK
jgi:hypothetical protein